MSPKLPRDVYGVRLARVLCSHFGYEQRNQIGSHIILDQIAGGSGHLAIPAHKPLRVGMLAALLSDFEQQTGRTREEVLRRI